jgi:putative salt-induced outer membrane protein YdiY
LKPAALARVCGLFFFASAAGFEPFDQAGLSPYEAIAKNCVRLRSLLCSCIWDYLPLAKRSFILGVVALGLLLPADLSFAQVETGPTLAAPPATTPAPPVAAPPPMVPPAAAPTISPAAAATPEPPSDVWKPPAGAATGPYPVPTPEAELPIPGANDPAAAATLANPATKAILEQPQGPWYSPPIWLGPEPWDSGVELGVNGSSGTSDSFSVRTGAYIKRESRFSKLDFDTNYNFTRGDGKTSQNNAKVDITNDWLIDDKSPWTLFAKSNLFYDEFATFDLQTNLNMGVGYRWVHSPELELMTRVGAGAEREFGGDENLWKPESLIGFEYSQRVTKTQKFYGKLEYFPQWEQIDEFRAVGDVGWEIALIQPSNLSLKLSASDRYDSSPDGVSPHLVNYSVVLLLKL